MKIFYGRGLGLPLRRFLLGCWLLPVPVLHAATPPEGGRPASGIQLRRSSSDSDGGLALAFRLLLAGDTDQARREYERVLSFSPHSVDALLGLAATAQREGRQADAERFALQALETDPGDTAAQAVHALLLSGIDPLAAESRLNNLIANQPGAATLYFVLGNVFARQDRWAEARSAYLSAIAGEGNNPDFLFNLAISLDRLRQPELAARYYRRAAEAARDRGAGFAPGQADRRLRELQP